ncbi:NosR/NirI family protein [Sneathiella litorea]|uniref:4Fe-4S binding protein n=1 Tax=Sneathiella litorea TaxID=2606216 RepID=A0A6L8W6S6_9PROT|nr:NosR/NirI family protein [Sneathiella litorea]MZR30768.1 4Fe-4S binding protein [Sneathiella litorea]
MKNLVSILPRFSAVFLLAAVGILSLLPCAKLTIGAEAGKLSNYLIDIRPEELFDGAERYGNVIKNTPIVPVLQGKKLAGYAFLNTDFVSAVGYSGKPIDILIAMTAEGRIAAGRLMHHSEPIILSGIPEKKIIDFIAGYKNTDILELAREKGGEPPPVDIVSGATVTIMVIDDSIKRAAVRAAAALGLGSLADNVSVAAPKKSLIIGEEATVDWQTLVGNGSVRRMRLSLKDVNDAFVAQGNAKAIERPENGGDNETFIDLYVASLAIPTIAQSLLGDREYQNLKKKLKPGENAFLVMGTGRYSFRGSGYVRGGIFDRIQIIQGEEAFRFKDRGYKNLGRVEAEGAPDFKEVALFRTPKGAVFNPADPWELQLLVQRAIGALEKVFVAFELIYQLPDIFVHTEAAPVVAVAQPMTQSAIMDAEDTAAANALWQRIWKQKIPEIIILISAIVILTILFFVQDQVVRSKKVIDWFRIGFLTFTLFGIGFYAQAQLSVVNVFVFVNALLTDFQWQFFLMEPLIFILWCSVAVSLIFWGRGAFCGWLCPFGALQELTNKIARFVGIKQFTVPWWLHERLWPIKYIIFLGLLGLSIYSLHLAETFSEIEPFRTSIVLRFMRGWPYLLFVFSLLFAGLFIERFFCRYLCPLGAALAIPGKLAMFNWLKRYRNCGDPCQTCAKECMVQAIDPLGNINPNECLYCLHCQVNYYDEDVCPVVIHALAKARKTDPAAKTTVADQDPAYRRGRRLNQPREYE